MTVKAFDEVSKTLITVEGQVDCPWKSDVPEGQAAGAMAPHFFSSDSPDDNDTCTCGRFFFIAAKNLSGA